MSEANPMLTDLEEAKADLAQAQARQDAYTGNNPGKHDTEVRVAFEKVQALTQTLKAKGLIARTPHEALEVRLDAAFPKARHKEIVTLENARYRRRIEPATRTRSGQVSTWDKGWTALPGAPPAPTRDGKRR